MIRNSDDDGFVSRSGTLVEFKDVYRKKPKNSFVALKSLLSRQIKYGHTQGKTA